jgi:hypothetical protein
MNRRKVTFAAIVGSFLLGLAGRFTTERQLARG